MNNVCLSIYVCSYGVRLSGRGRYAITVRLCQSSVAVVVPHRGYIEPHTLRIARTIARDQHPFYLFESLKPWTWAS
ncbi:poly-gamma-glutamate hydrolase family protein [Daeguia caeni]|uniref:Poly-gamma-glutamate hydrolase family protein n=1 Tax=Daeguia caeni TaxID=439612 RepID=A0ABV9HAL8_9HYPH